ncbi:MAG: aldo/keto reductase [Muribaculaceae bacterium]|nr:aldo/keto reductase [Muribaculaceae bacterium]
MSTTFPSVYAAAADRYNCGMKYRRCGQSGILLPELSLGLWHNFGSVDPFQKSLETVHYAFDHGICHFDLANNYGPVYGSAEQTFGMIMRRSLAPYRNELFISTKAGHDMWPGPYGEWGSRKYLFNSLEDSLRRMNLDYVDVFYSHRYDPVTPLEETMQALVDIVRQGKALYVGISKYPAEKAQEAYNYLKERDVKCLVYQGRYNMFDRDVEGAVLPQAREAGVGFTAFSPLAQGLLSDRYLNSIPSDSRIGRGGYLKKADLTPEVLQKITALNEVARKRGQSLAQMAVAWLLRDEAVTSVIVGVSSQAQLASNIEALRHTDFSPEELAEIDRILSN